MLTIPKRSWKLWKLADLKLRLALSFVVFGSNLSANPIWWDKGETLGRTSKTYTEVRGTFYRSLPNLLSVQAEFWESPWLESPISIETQWKVRAGVSVRDLENLSYAMETRVGFLTFSSALFRVTHDNYLTSTSALTTGLMGLMLHTPNDWGFGIWGIVGIGQRAYQLKRQILIPQLWDIDHLETEYILALGFRVDFTDSTSFQFALGNLESMDLFHFNNAYLEGRLAFAPLEFVDLVCFYRHQILLGFGYWDASVIGFSTTLHL